MRKEPSRTWLDLKVPCFTPDSAILEADVQWHTCKYVVSQHGDRCGIGSWVFATTLVRF